MERANSSIGRGRYMADGAWPSLFRNGRVLTRRDRDGNDANSEGVDTTEYTIAINDGRALDDDRRRTVESHEFELLSRPLERSNRGELLRQAGPPARLVVVSGDDAKRAPADQAMGLRR